MMCAVKCQVHIQPRGRLNSTLPNLEAWVDVNRKRVWTSDFSGPAPLRCGVTTMFLDPYSGTVSHIKWWVTSTDTTMSTNLASYINMAPTGSILLGVTMDDPTKSLQPALGTLTSLGIDVTDVVFHGDFAFIIQKGYNNKTQFVKGLTSADAPALSVTISGQAVDPH